jgi:hypothetical protein
MRGVDWWNLPMSLILMLVGCGSSADSPRTRQSGSAAAASLTAVTEAQRFVRQRYQELLKFKSSAEFHHFGFGRGGPYCPWLESVEAGQNDRSYSGAERVAIGDLQTLGLEYVKTRGAENDYTRFVNAQIQQAIAAKR